MKKYLPYISKFAQIINDKDIQCEYSDSEYSDFRNVDMYLRIQATR